MPCFFPLTAWKSADLDDINSQTGKHKLVFREDLGFPNTRMEIPCGQCAGCRLDRARSWAIRCVHEASLHKENCFLTLTYSNENLPENGSLNKRDITLFLKRLRRAIEPKRIRFFQCGEYGEQFGRPHHHCLLFGHNFPDRLLLRGRKENKLYSSETLQNLWPHGFASVGDVTFDSACYVARYVLKKITGETADEHYQGRMPEYVTMSRRPGIAREWYDKYKTDIYNHDKCVVSGQFIARPPAYYDRLYEQEHAAHFKSLKLKRRDNAKNNPENTPAARARLAEYHEEIQKNQAPRSFEQIFPT